MDGNGIKYKYRNYLTKLYFHVSLIFYSAVKFYKIRVIALLVSETLFRDKYRRLLVAAELQKNPDWNHN